MSRILSLFTLLLFLFSCGNAEKESMAPLSPTSLNVALDTNSSTVKLTWTDNSKYEKGYIVERRTDNSGWTEIDTVDVNINYSYDYTYIQRATNYYRVYAYNTNGISEKSDEARIICPTKRELGNQLYGGIIAYILQPGDLGYVAGEIHGLIAAVSDQESHEWGCSNITVGGTSTSLGSGASNTDIVSSSCGIGTAARLCSDLDLNGYSDWYLPSKDELYKLFINRGLIGGFSTGFYWSSSEAASHAAFTIYFDNGSTNYGGKSSTWSIRAVRAF